LPHDTCTTSYDLLNIEASNTGGRWLRIVISASTPHIRGWLKMKRSRKEDAVHALTRFHLEAQATLLFS